jgi:glycosyltransferase involved in cell wall biosynthesis
MRTPAPQPPVDIVMAGTFSAWHLGTLQARALPFAHELQSRGLRCAIVTVPWDMPSESGVIDTIANVELRNTTATGVTSFPLAVVQQAALIRALQPRLVHVFKPKGYGGLAGRLRPRGLPLVIDSDDWEGDGGWNQHGNYSALQRRLFNWQERTLLQSADAVTAASHLLKRRALTLRHAPPETVSWVPNGLAGGWLRRLSSARANAQAADDAPTVLLYSRFAEFPADWLPRYLGRLSAGLAPDACANVILVGDSVHVDIGYRNVCINHMGYVAYTRLPEVLGRADIAIFPYADSLIARSKNSVKLLELMAAGCAVIASGTGDVPAVAGDAAILLDSSEPATFAAATVDLQRNAQRIRRLSSAAELRVQQQFSIAAVTGRLIDAYCRTGVLSPCSNG